MKQKDKYSSPHTLRIKEATRRLKNRAKGLETASDFCRVGKTSLGYFGSVNHEQHIPADVIADLETYIGDPLVTRVLAELQGYKLEPSNPSETILCIRAANSAVVIEMGDVARAEADMYKDGIEDIGELERLLNEQEELAEAAIAAPKVTRARIAELRRHEAATE